MARKKRDRQADLDADAEFDSDADADVDAETDSGSDSRSRRRIRARERERSEEPVRVRPRRRFPILTVLAVLAIGLAFAPQLIRVAAIRQALLQRATAGTELDLQVASASAQWWSPVVLRQVELVGAEREPLAEAAEIRTSKSLFALLMDRSNLGTIQIAEPSLTVVARPDGTNIEDALAPLLRGNGSTAAAPDVRLVVTNGTVGVADTATGASWQLDDLNGELSLAPSTTEPLAAAFTTSLTGPAGTAPISASLSWQADEEQENPLGQGQLTLETQELALEAIEPWLRRFVGNYSLAGQLTGKIHLQWQGSDLIEMRIDRLSGQTLRLAATDLLGADRLEIVELDASGNARLQNGKLRLEGVRAVSELGELVATCELPVRSLGAGPGAIAALLQGQDLDVDATVDLARLARTLPETLRVRPGTRIESGSIHARLTSENDTGPQRWHGKLRVESLVAVEQGKRLSWDTPLEVTLEARPTPQGPIVEELACIASFLDLRAQGSPSRGSATVDGDLGKLTRELDRFIDLGEILPNGRVQGKIDWRSTGDRFNAGGDLTLEQFAWRDIREEQLRLTLQSTGRAGEGGLATLESSVVTLHSGSDQLHAELLGAVENPTVASQWPLRYSLRGKLESWLARLGPFLPTGMLAGNGMIEIDGETTVSPRQVAIDQARIRATSCSIRAAGLTIEEPEIVLESSANFDWSKRRFESGVTTLASSALAFRAEQLLLELDGADPRLSGNFGFRGDLARLGHWWRDPRVAATQQLTGSVTGQAKFSHQDGRTRANVSTELRDVVFLERAVGPAVRPTGGSGGWTRVWAEPHVTLACDGEYDAKAGRFGFQRLDCSAPGTLKIAGRGDVIATGLRCDVDLEAEVEYDLERAVEKLRPYIGDGLIATGHDARHFVLRGPLFAPRTGRASANDWSVSAELAGGGSLGWQRLDYQGLSAGAGDLKVELENGTILVSPLDVRVGDGRVRVAPRIELNRAPAAVVIGPGAAVENARLSPELCHDWLKYVNPLVAEATDVEGRFSLDMEGAVIPLKHPKTGNADGQLRIHAARVGPGPLARQILAIAEQVKAVAEGKPLGALGPSAKSWLDMPEQTIDFHVENGVVYHRGVVVEIGDVEIRTSGGVGLDQSLDVVAEIPVRDEWLKKDRLLAALKGQVLRIPISGEMSRPKVDSRVLQNLTTQTIGNAAEKLIEGEVTRGLEKLLGPLKGK